MTTDTMRAAVGAIHQQIMNLPDGVVKARHSEFLQGFQEGHKAARHAAAELVSSALSLLRAALDAREDHSVELLDNDTFRKGIRDDGTVEGYPVETYYLPCKGIGNDDGFLRVLMDDNATDAETRVPYSALQSAGWTLAASTAAPKEEGEPVAYLVDWADIGEGTAQSLFYDANAKEHMEGAVSHGKAINRAAKVTPLYNRPIAADTQGDAKDAARYLLRFEHTYCSQCGKDLGPGDHGVSSCCDHGACQVVARGGKCECDRTPAEKEQL